MLVYAKAIAAGLVAGLTSIITALGDNHLSPQEIITAVIAFIVATGIIARVPNKSG